MASNGALKHIANDSIIGSPGEYFDLPILISKFLIESREF